MIRRILYAEFSDVRAIAVEAKRRALNAIYANVYVDLQRYHGCAFVGRNPGRGIGYILDCELADNWPSHARLLTIGRVTLAAWGRAKKGVDS
jgi:hypothetical protein